MSDNDFDAELLALAGDDSASENEDIKPSSRPSKSLSPEFSTAASRKARPPTRIPKTASQRKTTKSTKPATSRPKVKDDSEEEGQASSPDSLGSGAMSESESDTSVAGSRDVDEAVRFPVDGIFYSERDKSDIMAMPELRREAILAERALEVQRKTQDIALRKLRVDRIQTEVKVTDLKRKVGAAELEESPRKVTRAKVKATENLEAYKRQREQRNEQRQRNEDLKKSGVLPPSQEEGISDADAEGESDVEWDDGPSKSAPARNEPQPELRDYERIRVGRTNFAKVCFYPGFSDAIKGCFCRVNIGADKATGQNIYRMTQIKGFTTGRPYVMEGPNGRPFSTEQYAIVVQGKAEKEWPFSACSDSRFTDAEFERYKRATVGDGLRTPTLSFATAKCNGIHELLNHRWTEEEITEKLRRSGVIEDQSGHEARDKLNKDREQAIADEDEASIARLDQELAALDGPKLGPMLNNATSKPQAPKPLSQQERLAALNRANRKANAEEIRKAQLAEKRREQLLHSAVARGEAVANPFARVKTRAKTTYDVADLKVPNKAVDDLFGEVSDVSRSGTPQPGAGKKNGTATPQRTGGFGKKKRMDDEIMASMDLGIDIEI